MSERNGVTFSDSAACRVSFREAVDGQDINEQIEGQGEVTRESQTRELSTTLLPFELLWTAIASVM